MKIAAKILTLALLAMALPLSSASASILFRADMNAANETTPNPSLATGTAWVTLFDDMHTLSVLMNFSGLEGGNASASHIHCCSLPGVNAPVRLDFGGTGFPAATSGTYSHTFDLSLITLGGGMTTSAFVTGLISGLAYTNIHNQKYPGGEIRGQLLRVPEPASLALFGLGLAGLGFVRRKRVASAK